MTLSYTRLLQFYKQFGKFYDRQFGDFSARTGLSMREIHVLLFLANNPGYDTARDISELRGLSKSQVSQAVELLAAEGFRYIAVDAIEEADVKAFAVVLMRLMARGKHYMIRSAAAVPKARAAARSRKAWQNRQLHPAACGNGRQSLPRL